MDHTQQSSPRMPGLMDDLVPVRGDAPRPRASLRLGLPRRASRWWSDVQGDPGRRRRVRRIAMALGGLLLVGGGVGAYFALREKPQPDYLASDIDDILDYTILSDEFNNLPIEKRMELLGQLVSRLKKFDSGDSELLAAFAAGIKGDIRRQLEENISRLAIDSWDQKAAAYEKLGKDASSEERREFLEKSYVDFEKMMETVGGRVRNVSDEDRLARAKKDGKREYESFKEGKRPGNSELGEFVGFMNNKMASHAAPSQRARGAGMMRDMTRVFRGQDPATGKAPGGG
jgi:hypothetical protein